MKNLKLFILSLFSTILFAGCNEFDGLFEDLFGENADSEIKEDVIEYLDEVILLDQYQIDSVQILNDENINVYTNEDLKSKKFENKIIVYTNENDSRKCFIGRVLNVENKGDFFKINTKIPAMDEVFSELNLCPELNLGTSEYSFTPDPNDDVEFCGIVNNDIWESIQVVATDSTEFRTRTTSSEESFSSPIDITLKFASKSSSAFQGNLYYRIKGAIEIRKDCSYEISVHQIIGLDGSFKIASVSTGRKYIPLLTVKNGITLYSNKLVGIRVKPSVNFFYSGEIKLEAGFKYELMNVDTYVAFENGDFYNKSMDNKRDWFFRVKSLKSKASFGMSLNSDFYAFIFSDNFFQGGVQAAAGLEISGESNVGIQFPDVANFDFKVGVSPFLEVKPYAAVRLPNLKRIEGPTMSVKTSRFSKSLIPNFHDMNYKKANRKLHYDAIVASFEDSFVDAPECGIALFEKGKEEPISYGALKQSATRSSTQNNTFSISNGVIYEIAPYVKTYSDGNIIGERIVVDVDSWILFYESTNGDTWINNSNWCSNKNQEQWYGVSYSDYGYNLSLSNNNLTGDAYFYDLNIANADILTGNNIKTLTIEESYIGNLVATNTSLKNLTITGGGVTIPNSSTLSIDNVYIENSGTTLKTRGKLGTVIVTNCGGYINIEGSGDILKIHHQDGGADIRGNWNYIEIIGGGGGIDVYGSIGRFFCPDRGGGTCLNGVWNDWGHWQ